MTNQRSESVQRTLEILPILAGNEIHGVPLVKISDALSCSKPLVLRALANLQIAGFAEQMDNKNWRLGPRLSRIAMQTLAEFDKQQRKLDELRNRHTRQY